MARMPTIPLRQANFGRPWWHRHCRYVWVIATLPGPTGPVPLTPSAELAILPCPCQRKGLDSARFKNFLVAFLKSILVFLIEFLPLTGGAGRRCRFCWPNHAESGLTSLYA
jgi:hypothetical protein